MRADIIAFYLRVNETAEDVLKVQLLVPTVLSKR